MTMWGAIIHVLTSLNQLEARMDELEGDKLNPSKQFIAAYKAGHADGIKATQRKSNYCVGIAWAEYQKTKKKAEPLSEPAQIIERSECQCGDFWCTECSVPWYPGMP